MLTSARVAALRELGGVGWITTLRAPAIAALADAGVIQPSLFDQTNLAEVTHPDYPGERLVVCRNPLLGAERARKRAELLAATAAELDKVAASVQAGRLADPARIGVKAASRWPSTSPWTSPTVTSPTPATSQRSTPRRPWTASMWSAPA
jgi:hypothetical protein